MNTAFLLSGSNIGDRSSFLKQALFLLERKSVHIQKQSSYFETEPWGNEHQPLFLNQAIEVRTELSPEELLKKVLETEKELGRIREHKWSERTIDLDILFYEQKIITTPELKVPHPEIQNRRFVLAPLNEIAPEFKHPVFNVTVAELLEQCKDPLKVLNWDEKDLKDN